MILANTQRQIGIVLGLILVAAWLVYVITNLRKAKPEVGSEIELAPNRKPYLDDDQLDVHAWARDALALALPTQIICSADCKGICAICGENLNLAGPGHAHEPAPDPRWAALRELRFE